MTDTESPVFTLSAGLTLGVVFGGWGPPAIRVPFLVGAVLLLVAGVGLEVHHVHQS